MWQQQNYLTLSYPEANRFNMRISEWHDLTTVYRKQLFDLDKNDYINFKTAEHKNQVVLQRRIGAVPGEFQSGLEQKTIISLSGKDITMKNRAVILLALVLTNSACVASSTNINTEERSSMQILDEKAIAITRFEKVPAGEERLIKSMTAILQKKMSEDYPAGQTKRDAHPKTLACLQAEFIVEPDIPAELKTGIFAFPQTYPAWVRISSSSGKIQSDKAKDLRGFAIKIMGVKGERFLTQNEEEETQDFILISYPTMPLGTVELFHEAVYYSIEWSPLAFLTRLVLSGNFTVINELRKARQNQSSPMDIRYWSTTPYLYGQDLCVKYSIVPTSEFKSQTPHVLTEHYLSENMEKHLSEHEASFDFMIQVQKDPGRMPVEDAGVEWSEKESPFIKVATIRISPQAFRTTDREELAEDLSFSPAHSLIEHRPIGGINRARVEIYRSLSEFRHKQNNRQLIEPGKLTTKAQTL